MFFKPYIKKIVFVLILMFISVAISMVTPLISKHIMDDGLLKGNLKTVEVFCIFAFVLTLIDEIIDILETKYIVYLNSLIKYKLNSIALRKLFNLGMEYFDNNNVTEITKNISMDIDNTSMVLDRGTLFIVTLVLKIIGGFIGLILIDWKLTLCIFIYIPIKYFFVKKLSNKRRKTFEKYMENNRDYNCWYGDTVQGIREIKLWSIDGVKKKEFTNKQRQIIKSDIKFALFDNVNDMFDTVLMSLLTNSLYIVGAYFIFNSNLTIGSLIAFITYSAYVTRPISLILNVGYRFSSVFPSAKRLFDFLDMEDERNSINKISRLELKGIKGNIEFRNVIFTYKNGEKVLDNISFKINEGEKVIIVGENGSGKSTLIKILLGLYKIDSGEILIDGIDINNLKLKDYRKLFSVVSQDIYMFNGTINNNISLFSDISNDKVINASKLSGASEFIDELPENYETKLGKDGIKLSGGQAQRLAIARALAKEFKILIFDEATSNCDVKSHIYINDILQKFFKDKTALIITHRMDLSLLESVDKIIVLEKGKIKDIGNHNNLIKESKLYKNIIQKYYSNFD